MKKCPTGTFLNSKTNQCVSCLVNYGQGEGACADLFKPLCNSTDYTCQACPSDSPYWDDEKHDCVKCLAGYGSEKAGACTSSSMPLCDSNDKSCKACPTNTTWDIRTQTCLAICNGCTVGGKCVLPSDGTYVLSTGTARAKHGYCSWIKMTVTPPGEETTDIMAYGATNPKGGHSYVSGNSATLTLPKGTVVEVTAQIAGTKYCSYSCSIGLLP